MSDKKQILLTNDDGIQSPGLWAAASALENLGYVTVAAPLHQHTGAGRSMPSSSAGRIHEHLLPINGRTWTAYAVEGTPAQVVQHALLELMPRYPDLVVSGINYGENVGSGVTISGTVGAALEGASFGLPALAVSLQTESHYHHTYSTEIDFSTAAHFTRYFAERLLAAPLPPDVDVLKVEVPETATPHTPWRVTRLSRHRYYFPVKPQRAQLTDKGGIGYRRAVDEDAHTIEPDSDVGALLAQIVSVTPLSLDMTSRVDLNELKQLIADC
jgi:5'-nucleotidase